MRPEPDVAAQARGGILVGQGFASWYGSRFHGRPTANGERFDRFSLTAAHRTLPFGTRVCVRSLPDGKTVLVRINDRGPFAGKERIIDLSQGAAQEIGMIGTGIQRVELWQVDEEADCTPTLGDGALQAQRKAVEPEGSLQAVKAVRSDKTEGVRAH